MFQFIIPQGMELSLRLAERTRLLTLIKAYHNDFRTTVQQSLPFSALEST
ncbi:hypothetical protein ACFQUX_07690 [Pantoea stewartii]